MEHGADCIWFAEFHMPSVEVAITSGWCFETGDLLRVLSMGSKDLSADQWQCRPHICTDLKLLQECRMYTCIEV